MRDVSRALGTLAKIREFHETWGSIDLEDLDLVDLWETLGLLLAQAPKLSDAA